MHIGRYLDLVHRTEVDLAAAFKKVAKSHGEEPDVYQTCQLLAKWSEKLATDIEQFVKRYNKEPDKEPDRLTKTLLKQTRKGGMALLRDLHDLWLVVSEVEVSCVVLNQGAQGLRDEELITACNNLQTQTKRQLSWLISRMKSAAPQTLIVAPE